MVVKLGGCVYILTNLTHSVLYTGVTSDLAQRILDHRNKTYPKRFAEKYNCNQLVYYRFYFSIEEAISIEKLIKGGSRQSKIDLINSMNPEWKDLYNQVVES